MCNQIKQPRQRNRTDESFPDKRVEKWWKTGETLSYFYTCCNPQIFFLLYFIFTCIANVYLVLHERIEMSSFRGFWWWGCLWTLLFPVTAQVQHISRHCFWNTWRIILQIKLFVQNYWEYYYLNHLCPMDTWDRLSTLSVSIVLFLVMYIIYTYTRRFIFILQYNI